MSGAMRKSKMSDAGSAVAAPQNQRTKVIVDKDYNEKNDNFHENIQKSVENAIKSVEDGNALIKITSNLYEEKIEITQPNIEIRPKEKGGEVTI